MVKKNYTEAEMVRTFNLTRLTTVITPRMADWLKVEDPEFTPFEQYTFDKILSDAMRNMVGWNEEKLKMKFISPLLEISRIDDTDKYVTFYEKKIEDIVEGKPLSVKTDFMIATGLLDLYEKPFFHFQEYKPSLNPSGDPMGQLLQAMLIGQVKNKDNKPIYGCIIVGQNWNFVVIEAKEYCISPMYDAMSKKGLLAIISILRKFKYILETELID
jgi:hypothetical protein